MASTPKEMKKEEGSRSKTKEETSSKINQETMKQKSNNKMIDLNELPDDQGNTSVEEGRFQVVQMMTKIYFPSVNYSNNK